MKKEDLIKQIADTLKKRDASLLAAVEKELRSRSVNVTKSFSGR